MSAATNENCSLSIYSLWSVLFYMHAAAIDLVAEIVNDDHHQHISFLNSNDQCYGFIIDIRTFCLTT